MTTKKQDIANTALHLFAHEGYNAVSTKKIAEQAGVSEGLIFRHFESKKGLLDFIFADLENKIGAMFRPILEMTDPKEVIRRSIDLFFSFAEEDIDIWRLLFRLKWQEGYVPSNSLNPVHEKAVEAFSKLGYQHPELETTLLERTLEGIITTIMQTGNDQFPLRGLLYKKYDLE